VISEPFEVADTDALVRRGMLTWPSRPPRAALLLLSAGLKYRTGPGQLYVDLARRLAASQIVTLRLDALGIGESDGALEAGHCHDLWRTVESGRFVPDAVLAFHALRRQLGVQLPIYLGGLCGGGLTALVAADVLWGRGGPAGVVSLNIAAQMTPPAGRRSAPVASAARAYFASYPRKLVSPAAWMRALTSTTSYAAAAMSVSALLPKHRRQTTDTDELNSLFRSSFRRLIERNVPHLLIFSGRDERWYHFADLVLPHELGGALAGPAHSVFVIEEAEHHLVRPEWREQAATRMTAFMTRPAARLPNASRLRPRMVGGDRGA
jgi:hypothetical protein